MTTILSLLALIFVWGVLVAPYAWLVHDLERSHNRTSTILREERKRLLARAAVRKTTNRNAD